MLRKLFIWGNFLLLLVFIAAVVKDLASPYLPKGWAYYQQNYRRMQAAAETSEESKKTIQKRPLEIKQILADDLGHVDRCTTCHQGMDSIATPTLANGFT